MNGSGRAWWARWGVGVLLVAEIASHPGDALRIVRALWRSYRDGGV